MPRPLKVPVFVNVEAAKRPLMLNRMSISNVMVAREPPDFGKTARTRPLAAPLRKVLIDVLLTPIAL